MSRVFFSSSLTGGTEWLARVASRDDVHQSSKCFCRERLNVRPDRCLIQFSRFHLCDQVRDCEGFDLHISDGAATWENSSESEINASVPGAKAEMIGLGSIHIIFPRHTHTCFRLVRHSRCTRTHTVKLCSHGNTHNRLMCRVRRIQRIGVMGSSKAS